MLLFARRTTLVTLVFFWVTSCELFSEPLPFRRAIELAVAHSPAVGMATADQIKARQGYLETRNLYMPQVVVGSGLGGTIGYPMSIEGSAPSVFNVNYQSAVLNFAIRDQMKAAQRDINAATYTREDSRKDSILETAVTYLQLDTLMSQLKSLREQQAAANQLTQIVQERVTSGIDSQMELTRSKLAAARVKLTTAQLEGAGDLLRQKLAQLTGLTASSIETVTESIPKLPQLDEQADIPSLALSKSSTLKAAEEKAAALDFRAKAEHKQLYPAIDGVAQYGYFTRFNNYDEFFRKFQHNNATLGVAVRFPILNLSQKAKAAGADAEALRSRHEVEATKNQISGEALRLQRQVKQLSAAQEVSQLEFDLAQAQANAVQIRVEGGGGAPEVQGQGAANPRDLANARLEATARYSNYLDSTFEYSRARIQLLRQTGEIEGWAMAGQ